MIQSDDEVIFIYALVKREDYNKVKLPEGSVANAMEIGEARETCDMEKCKGWGAMMGIAMAKFAKRNFPEAFKIMNPDGPNAKQSLQR